MNMTMLPNRHLSDYNEEGEVYDNYVETTVDPGQTLFIIAIILCISSLILLPLCVKIGKICLSKHKHGSDIDSAYDDYIGGLSPRLTNDSDLSCIQRCKNMMALAWLSRLRKRSARAGTNMDLRVIVITREVARETRESKFLSVQGALEDDDVSLTENEVELVMGDDQEVINDQTQIPGMSPEYEERNYQPPSIEPGVPPPHYMSDEEKIYQLKKPGYLRKKFLLMWTIVRYDNETKRLLRLIVPFTFSAVIDTIASLITVALISEELGTDSMVAFVMVGTVLGISSSFTGGCVEAISSLGSMAYGAGNYELVGQYVQATCIIYVLCEIPMAFLWSSQIGNVILWMGFEESVAVLAHSFVWVQVAINVVSGVNQAFLDFLEVVEMEAYASIMYSLSSVINVGLVTYFTVKMDVSLVVLGLIMLACEGLFFFLNISIPYLMGWLKQFQLGLFGKWADASVLKTLFKTALPLSFGGLLAYAEWEILIIFAAILGPAEAATWAILGYVWGVFESTTSAIGDASEVRCAYQLGRGRPALAKLSAYKSIFMTFIMSLLVSLIFLCQRNVLPSLLTKDATIQAMLDECLPFIALGNITMNMGMVCWALIGAQGRYRLATSIATACSLLITLPIGAISTIRFNIDLQGLTFAVVTGYVITAMLLFMVLLMSDWGRLSRKIQDKMAAEEVSDDETEQDEDEDEDGLCIEINLPVMHENPLT